MRSSVREGARTLRGCLAEATAEESMTDRDESRAHTPAANTSQQSVNPGSVGLTASTEPVPTPESGAHSQSQPSGSRTIHSTSSAIEWAGRDEVLR